MEKPFGDLFQSLKDNPKGAILSALLTAATAAGGWLVTQEHRLAIVEQQHILILHSIEEGKSADTRVDDKIDRVEKKVDRILLMLAQGPARGRDVVTFEREEDKKEVKP